MGKNGFSNIVICDDHYLTALGVELTLKDNSSEVLTIRKATTGKRVLELFQELPPQLLLLDLNLPDITGIEVIRKIREAGSKVKLIVLTGQSEPYLLKQVCQLEVDGLLRKSDTGKNLIDALEFISIPGQDKMFLDPSLQEYLGSAEIYIPTKREYEVLELMGQGLTSAKIAEQLECSVPTIKTYRSRIMEKSGTRNSAEMVSWFLQRNGKADLSSHA